MARLWKKGRGKLGPLQPLVGRWRAESDTGIGPVRCTRAIGPVLGGNYLRLEARWEFLAAGEGETGRVYEEFALIGAGDEGGVEFWSFTSDGKRSQGVLADVTDIHARPSASRPEMPAGLARMAYWPDGDGGFLWAVESRGTRRAGGGRRAPLPADHGRFRRLTRGRASTVVAQPREDGVVQAGRPGA